MARGRKKGDPPTPGSFNSERSRKALEARYSNGSVDKPPSVYRVIQEIRDDFYAHRFNLAPDKDGKETKETYQNLLIRRLWHHMVTTNKFVEMMELFKYLVPVIKEPVEVDMKDTQDEMRQQFLMSLPLEIRLNLEKDLIQYQEKNLNGYANGHAENY